MKLGIGSGGVLVWQKSEIEDFVMAITSAEVIVRHTFGLGLGRGSFAMRGRRVPAPKAGGRMWDASHARSARAADVIDYCIHRYCDGTDCSDSKLNPRRVCLSAIGECLRDEYDAVASPIPPHLAALVKRLETQK